MKRKILIVEDDKGLNLGISIALQEPGSEFLAAFTLSMARRFWMEEEIDLILLDINLPDGSGYDFLRQIRMESQVPVIMLTANDLEIDEVTGLKLGADDYITKPFSLMVLRARVERMLQRISGSRKNIYEKGSYFFDFESMFYSIEDIEITLSKTEQKLLKLFIENQGRILTREILVDRIWSDGAEYVDENALSVAVNRLRKKLECKKQKNPINTIYGTGYVWEK